MPAIRKTLKDERHIKFLWEIELSNGVIGKNIEINGKTTNYIITKDVKIYNIKTEKELKQFIGTTGYRSVNIQLGKKGNYKTRRVHRLYAYAYILNYENKPIINHKDGDKLNLNEDNLEWCTYSENSIHAIKTGLKKPYFPPSEGCNLTTHTKEEVILACELLKKGYCPKYISIKYPSLTYDFVCKLLKKETWKNITRNYDFRKIIKFSKFFTPEEVIEMEEMFKNDMTVKEVINKMNWEYNETLRGRVRQIQKRIRKLSSEGPGKTSLIAGTSS